MLEDMMAAARAGSRDMGSIEWVVDMPVLGEVWTMLMSRSRTLTLPRMGSERTDEAEMRQRREVGSMNMT